MGRRSSGKQPEQMGQTPVSPSLLAWPLSFLLTCLSRGPQARALPFTLGVLEVAAGALPTGLGAQCLSHCLHALGGAAGTSRAEPREEQKVKNHGDREQFGLEEILKLI